MTIELVLKGLPILILLVQGLMGWGMWSLSQKYVSRAECEECRKDTGQRVGSIERLVAVAEVRNASSVTARDLEKIYERINKVAAIVNENAGEMRSVRRTLDMINQHLMQGE